VKSFGWYEDAEAIYIAMEYCLYGDLYHYLSHKSPLPVAEAQELTRQMLEGVYDMHENGFAHRDLKPAVSKYLIPIASGSSD
jgi:serine/threonine protein kinase